MTVKLFPGKRMGVKLNGVEVGHYISTGSYDADEALARIVLHEAGHEKPEAVPMWQRIRQQARDFAYSTDHLYTTTMAIERTTRPFAIIPFVVMGAFSIELYLKALALKHGQVVGRKHKLNDIAQNLPNTAKRAMATAHMVKLKEMPGEYPDIEEYLGSLNDAFVLWRYSYEAEKMSAVTVHSVTYLQELIDLALEY